jgi:hypothetical protein
MSHKKREFLGQTKRNKNQPNATKWKQKTMESYWNEFSALGKDSDSKETKKRLISLRKTF